MPLCGHKIETTTDHFGDMVRNNCLLVDKTLMVKDFWQGQQVSLILRPRRFGKTLNLSMLQHFCAAEVNGQATHGLFDAFAIAKEDNGQWIAHQGQYPVIFISFKDVKQASYLETVKSINVLVSELYQEHEAALTSHHVSDLMKKTFTEYLTGSADNTKLEQSIRFLSQFIFKASGKKPIILIDEYDTPLTHGYQSHFIDEISLFLRNLLSAALKSNPYLEKGLMTGILGVSKNELLSGLNNIKVYGLFDDRYSQYFGFTEEEAAELTTRVPAQDSPEAIKAFYNGYRIGDRVIYNPWSLMNYLEEQQLGPYWVLTSGDHVLKKLFLQADADTKVQLSRLMNHEVITANISLKTSYEDLMESPQALWTLLLFAGYLTANSKRLVDDGLVCALRVPNREIIAQYRSIFSQWLTQTFGESRYQSFLTSLVCGDIARFTELLGEYLMNSLSFRDVGDKKGENFYHGFVAGLVASIGETHWVDSNKESGRGLYDVMLTPKDPRYTQGIIFEFKHVQGKNMNDAALQALKQIQQFDYATLLRRYSHITHIVKVGLAFSGKAVSSVYTTEIIATGEEGELIWTHEK